MDRVRGKRTDFVGKGGGGEDMAKVEMELVGK